jgi:DNA processing protein
MTGRGHHPRFDVTDDRMVRIAWSRLAEPGDRRLARLVDQVGPVLALRALLTRDVPWMAHYRARLDDLDPEQDLSYIRRVGGRVVVPGEAQWPEQLAQLSAPPFCLWVRGRLGLDLVTSRSVAVVGARAATTYGEHVTGEIAFGAAARGFVVVSGLAYGIDAAAHRAGLAGGLSLAVVAGGVDRAYPQGNERLMATLCEDGAVVSEVPPGSAPTRSRFLQRNRVIAALTSGTVVVEAARRSGALNTARTAAGLGRPVGAVPGPVTASSSAGCHALIRDGRAVLVTDAGEVAELIGRMGDDLAPVGEADHRPLDGLDPVTLRVLDALPVRSGRPLDRICATAGLEPATVQAALGRLALLGLADRDGPGWRLVRRPPERTRQDERQARLAIRDPIQPGRPSRPSTSGR